MNCLQNFLDLAAGAPPEKDFRHFRIWQRVSVHVQREVRSFASRNFFADERRAVRDMNRAYTIVVYSSCQPCYGRRPMEFTYDIGDIIRLRTVLRLIGRGMQTRLKQISAGIQSDPRLKRRFLPVWYLDILKAAKNKPRTLIEMLAREAAMINALINLGTAYSPRAEKLFVKNTASMARILRVDSKTLQDLVLRAGAENLGDGRIFEDGDVVPARSPDEGIGGYENRDDGSPDGRGEMADARIVPDIHACG